MCNGGETKSPCKSYTDKKRPKNGKDLVTEWCMERLFENLGLVKHPELPGALFLDPTIAKASRGIVPGPHKGGLQHLIWTCSCNGQRADTHWVMTYNQKTQSVMSYELDKFKEFMFIHTKNYHFFCEIHETVFILPNSFLHWK